MSRKVCGEEFLCRFGNSLAFFHIFATALNHQGGLMQNILTKAFSGRFGFDVLELRNFKLSVKTKQRERPM